MNRLVRQSHRILVALALTAFLIVQAAPALSSVQFGDAGRLVTPLANCDDDTCG